MHEPKPKFKLVVLVLSSSDDGGLFDQFKGVWLKYSELFPEIKVYFVYAGRGPNQKLGCDLIYSDLVDSYPIFIDRTIRAFEYVKAKYDYEFLLRTNLSTFWDFKQFLLDLAGMPSGDFYYGSGPLGVHLGKFPRDPKIPEAQWDKLRMYLSGVDTLVPKSLVEKFLVNKNFVNRLLIEDQAMGEMFYGLLDSPIVFARIHQMVNFGEEPAKEDIIAEIEIARRLKHSHFRIKSRHANRQKSDIFIANTLFEYYYTN